MAEHRNPALESGVSMFIFTNHYRGIYEDLTFEDARAFRENLDQESLTIFDLLRTGKSLSPAELKEVKKVSVDLLTKLKEEKLRIERWRESRQITAQVKTIIFDTLQWLPQTTYSDQDVSEKTINVYQHIYTNYPGGQFNTYTRATA